MSLEGHLAALGIKLPTSLTVDDIKKAYRAKALQCHPDRNPGDDGTMFRRVQVAYEFLLQRHAATSCGAPTMEVGPLGSGAGSAAAGAGATARAFYAAQSSGRPCGGGGTPAGSASPPLFTDAELFADVGPRRAAFGDFGQNGRSATGPFTSAAMRSGGNACMAGRRFRQASTAPRDRPPDGSDDDEGPPAPPPRHAATGDTEEKIARDRAAAEAARTQRRASRSMEDNVSAYAPFGGDEDALREFMQQQKQFERMETAAQRARQVFSQQPSHGVEGLPHANTFSSFPCSPGAASTPDTSPLKSSATAATAAGGNPYKFFKTRDELRKEWDEMRETAKLEAEAKELRDRAAREMRRHQLDAETKEEWRKVQAELQNTAEKNAMAEATARLQRGIARSSDTDADRALRSVAAQRRAARSEHFNHLVPTNAACAKMSDGDLFILASVLRERLAFVERQVASNAAGTCAVCAANRRCSEPLFRCEHCVVCSHCVITGAVLECPVCGGDPL